MEFPSFTLHDESINCYGFWLSTAGADIVQFERNPIMLYMHNRSGQWADKSAMLPIGHWENVRIEKGSILADPVFDDDDFSQTIAKKVAKKTLRMASVGAKPIETSTDPKWLKPGQTRETVIKWVLREASIVDIGGNDNALAVALYDNDDKLIDLAAGNDCPIRLISEVKTKPQIIMKKPIWNLLGLGEGSSDELVNEKIQNLVDRNNTLEASVTNLTTERDSLKVKLADIEKQAGEKKKAAAIALVDAAIKDGRIDAGKKDQFVKLFEADHDSAAAILADMKPHTPVAGKLTNEGDTQLTERQSLEKLSWTELDKQGKLQTLKLNHPDLYKDKFKVRFGKEPAN